MGRPLPTHHTAFADELQLYDVFSLYRDGREEMRVIGTPLKQQNLVGERSHVLVRVTLVGSDTTGDMIFRPANIVHVRRKEGTTP